MNKYVILTANIHPIGGMQLYTSGKAKFLKKRGWDVLVLYDGNPLDGFQIADLETYNEGAFPILSFKPNYLSSIVLKHALNRIKKYISPNAGDVIYIESQSDLLALWGEVIAKEIGAKHLCFNCNEKFRGHNKCYEEYIDFFWFKYSRRELVGLHSDSLALLFDGYYEVPCSKEYVFDAVEPGPIQDVENSAIDGIVKCDFNIAYLGRSSKGYVPNIIDGVCRFAENHKDRTINFILIGDAQAQIDFINETFRETNNVTITFMGDLVPIPRKVYSKIDLMIAGAVCAEISAREGVPTLVADCNNYLCNGLLGYTIDNSMYHNPDVGQISFSEGIEQALIDRIQDNLPYTFPEAKDSDCIFESQFDFYNNSIKETSYYSFTQNKGCGCFIKSIIKEFFPWCYFRKIKKHEVEK